MAIGTTSILGVAFGKGVDMLTRGDRYMNTQHAPDLIDILRGQYTRNNDGGGLHGTCRVDNNALLELCRMTEELIKQRDELLAAIFKYQKSAEECNTADGFGMWAAIQDWEDFSEAIAKAGGE